MKILYIITKGNWGGAQRYVFDLATIMHTRGNDVVVACGEGEDLPTRLHGREVRTIRLAHLGRDVSFVRDLKTFFELRNLIKTEAPDVLHLNSSKAGLLGALAARSLFLYSKLYAKRYTLPAIIFTAHGWPFNEKRSFWTRAIFKCGARLTARLSTTVIAVSQKTAKDVARLSAFKNKLVVIYNGIGDIPFIEGFKARQKLFPDSDKNLWIGCIAELHKNKGLDFLIKAYAEVAHELTDSLLFIIGEGEERSNLETLIKEHSLEKKVYLLGAIPEAAQYLKAFDIFVLPSRTEALPYVLLEAGRASLPVIGSDVGGIPEIIGHDRGLLVPVGDIHKLSKALFNLAQNTDLQLGFGEKLLHFVSTTFTTHLMAEETINVYNKG